MGEVPERLEVPDRLDEPERAELRQLERQVERGSLFVHTALGQGTLRLGETMASLHGLLDVLLAKGIVTEAEVATAIGRVRDELAARGELAGPGTAVRAEPPAAAAAPAAEVDCASRMHVCQAVCCKLNFALSIPEVEAGKVKWDLGRPYFIRHEQDGYCHHRGAGGCGVYADRPGVCRTYSCANDARIWTDFEGMQLNRAWIEANLPPANQERVVGTLMQPAADGGG